MNVGIVAFLLACACAFVFGFAAVKTWSARARFSLSRNRARSGYGGLERCCRMLGQERRFSLLLAVAVSMRMPEEGSFWVRMFPATARWLEEHRKKSGVENAISPAGACAARVLLAACAGICGVAVGCVFSDELAWALAASGSFIGWHALPKSLLARQKERAGEAERALPHMLEVMAMGVRSGLSFDRSMQLYVEHFDTSLAHSCEMARRQWTTGFLSRERALGALAADYDSELVSRAIGMMVRSLKLGTSLADDLMAAAADARAAYSACRKEGAAKVPVKMMVSTGVFMLPAMLLLVLGPILLELMGGF